MNDENSSPNTSTDDNSQKISASNKPKKGLFQSKKKKNNIDLNPNNSNHSAHKPKKGLKKPIDKITRIVNNNKVAFLVVIVFIAAIGILTFWYFNNKSNIRVLNTNNQVIKEYSSKLPELKKAVSADANSAAAHKNYAVALYVTGNYEAAKNEYEAVVKIDSKDSTAYNNLGNAYRDLGKYDKAKTAYEKSFEINATSINPYVNLANIQLYTLNDSGAAIATYQKALKAMPNNNQISLLLGIAYEKAGKTTEAKQTYQDILTRNADDKAAKAGLDRLNK